MKTMKRLFATVLAVMMAFCLSVPAFAASITVTNSAEGQTYSAWKIFDVVTDGTNYAYTLDVNNSTLYNIIKDVEGVTLTPSADGSVYVVTMTNDDTTAKALAAALLAAEDKLGTATGTATADSDGNATIDGLDAGYYFVDSSLGALCFMQTTTDTLTISEKNAKPTDSKTADETSYSVGDTVTFTITVNAGGAADTSYIVHDTMSGGLTLDKDSFEVWLNDATKVDSSNYTITTSGLTDGCTFEINFPVTYTSTLDSGDVITITYKATVNKNAVTGSETNKEQVQYGNSYTTGEKVTVYNYQFDLKKTDEDKKALSGAEFDLYGAATGGSQIKLVAVDEDGDNVTDYYRPATAAEAKADGFTSAKIVAGTATIKGLAAGTYYLEETKAPDGYNMLTARQKIEITENSGASTLVGTAAVTVVNEAGSELPSTGGMGTTLFYVIGGIMVAGAAVLLVTKKRMND